VVVVVVHSTGLHLPEALAAVELVLFITTTVLLELPILVAAVVVVILAEGLVVQVL
jgi:hypothetical protein